jgi:hypothetical protein
MLALASAFVVPAVMGPRKPGHSLKVLAARARGASLDRVAALLGLTLDAMRRTLTEHGLTLPSGEPTLDAIGQASGRTGCRSSTW